MVIEKSLQVKKREGRGKGATGRLRSKNMVPGVFYTASGDNILVQAEALPLEKIYESVGKTTVFNLEIENDGQTETHPVLIWQVQRHPYKNQFMHIDYYGVDLEKEIKVDVPIEFTGTAKGVKLGGIQESYREIVRLQSKPLDMPKKIVVDVNEMNIGDTINVADLKLPENVSAVYDQNYAIVSILTKDKDDDSAQAGEEAQ